MKRIPVYLCTLMSEDSDILRNHFFSACEEVWSRVRGVDLYVVTPRKLKCTDFEFQKLRRVFADEHSESSVYVIADDDCLLEPQGLNEVFDAHECAEILVDYWHSLYKFARLSLWPTNSVLKPWVSDEWEVYSNSEVMEHNSVGGVKFCIKGALPNWPEQTKLSYDMEEAQALRDQGYRVGYFRGKYMNHLGRGYSQIWPKIAESNDSPGGDCSPILENGEFVWSEVHESH